MSVRLVRVSDSYHKLALKSTLTLTEHIFCISLLTEAVLCQHEAEQLKEKER